MKKKILAWMLGYSLKRLTSDGYRMYVRRAGMWEAIDNYSFSQNGPPQPLVTVSYAAPVSDSDEPNILERKQK